MGGKIAILISLIRKNLLKVTLILKDVGMQCMETECSRQRQ